MLDIAWLDPAGLTEVWSSIKPLALKLEAQSKGEHTEASIVRSVVAGEYALVAAIEDDELLGLTAVKETTDGSGRNLLVIMWTVGNHASRWSDGVIEALTEFGEAQGFHSIKAVGRKGWARKSLKDFTVTRWIYEKELR